MKRRSAIKSLSLGIGYTMSAASMTMFISSCKQDGTIKEVASEWAPSFLSRAESTVLENILDAMLPTTASSPGYKAVSAIQMFDNTLAKLWKKEDQDDFKAGLSQVVVRVEGIASLDDFTPGLVDIFMKDTMGEISKEEKDRRGGIVWGDRAELKSEDEQDFYFYKFIHNVRNLGISTYFSNETIATEYLVYDPIPGGYEGCTTMTEGQKSWSF